MINHTSLMKNIGEDDKFQAWKYRVSLVFEENELDTHISGEVPDLEGDESKILTQKELVTEKTSYGLGCTTIDRVTAEINPFPICKRSKASNTK